MGNRDGVERELKFAGVVLDQLRDRLLEVEAERIHGGIFEENWVFDRDGELFAAGCLLRLRKDSQGCYLTFKGPTRFDGSVKVRPEHEVEVSDAEVAAHLLEGLGYEVVKGYQKVRETWQLGGVSISLDHTPIGDFAEFEGDGAEKVARRCGFESVTVERRSYLRLYQDYLADHPEAPPDMVFTDRE